MTIQSVDAYTIFDSRGNPTVEAEIVLTDGSRGRGVAPSGASTGQFEAHELRDCDPNKFRGKSVFKAVENVIQSIAPAIISQDVLEQRTIDQIMIDLDGTPNKSRLGANAILAVSTAVAAAAAESLGVPLYERLGSGTLLPIPEIQMVGGGAHANWRVDIQDFLLIAMGANSYEETLEITFNTFREIGKIIEEKGRAYGAADEGGYWPEFDSHEDILQTVTDGIRRAGYEPGVDAGIALDVAASDLYDESAQRYRLRLDGEELTSIQFADKLSRWCDTYPIISLEDPFADVDWDGWKVFFDRWGTGLQIIGDDLFTTNLARIKDGISAGIANAVLIKLNQIGTVSETLDAIELTKSVGWTPVVSARSGETEDAFISHLAVGTSAGQLKVGSFTRSERMVKWNEVLRIARTLGGRAEFKPWKIK